MPGFSSEKSLRKPEVLLLRRGNLFLKRRNLRAVGRVSGAAHERAGRECGDHHEVPREIGRSAFFKRRREANDEAADDVDCERAPERCAGPGADQRAEPETQHAAERAAEGDHEIRHGMTNDG